MEIFFDQQADLLLGKSEATLLRGLGVGVFSGLVDGSVVARSKLFREDVFEDQTPIVPYCIVLRVLGEETGGGLEGCVGVVSRFDLDMLPLELSHI